MTDKELVKRLRGMDGDSMSIKTLDEAADLIEALTAKLTTCEEIGRAFEKDAGQLRDKLAKAVEGLREIAGFAEKEWVTPNGEAPPDVQNLCDIARATLAEIEGEQT